MLDRYPTRATLPVSDMERAKAWYREKLMLTPKEEDPSGTYYETGGTLFALFQTPMAGTAKNTQMGWRVDDIGAVVDWLKGNGVTFERFEAPNIEWDGDIAKMGPYRSAWFKDSEGNTLVVAEG